MPQAPEGLDWSRPVLECCLGSILSIYLGCVYRNEQEDIRAVSNFNQKTLEVSVDGWELLKKYFDLHGEYSKTSH